MNRPGPVILITGGAGFLGQAVLRQLLDSDKVLEAREIRLFDRREAPPPRDRRVHAIVGDIRDGAALHGACRGVDLVLHCAALIDWGQHAAEEVRSVNVEGTAQVIRACQRAGVPALVHVSTLDVVLGLEPIVEGDEALPYPARHGSVYCASKAEAEKLALRANGLPRCERADDRAEESGAPKLAVTVLRPCCIFGEGDPYHVSSLLRASRRLPLPRIGDGSARHQHVYVGNMAHALLLAGRALLEQREGVAGEAFFITDFPAQNFFDYLEPVLAALGQRVLPWRLALPFAPLYGLALLSEGLAVLLRPIRRWTPALSRFSVRFVCTNFTVRGDKAARVLGYRPIYDERRAFARTIAYFREHGPVATPRVGGRHNRAFLRPSDRAIIALQPERGEAEQR